MQYCFSNKQRRTCACNSVSESHVMLRDRSQALKAKGSKTPFNDILTKAKVWKRAAVPRGMAGGFEYKGIQAVIELFSAQSGHC